jgi:archaellum biogenesis ATPase FlaH
LTDLNEHSTTLLERISKNYQPHQKKSNFVCVSSCANAYNYSHNEISENIEKCKKLSEARWNDQLIEYICNN